MRAFQFRQSICVRCMRASISCSPCDSGVLSIATSMQVMDSCTGEFQFVASTVAIQLHPCRQWISKFVASTVAIRCVHAGNGQAMQCQYIYLQCSVCTVMLAQWYSWNLPQSQVRASMLAMFCYDALDIYARYVSLWQSYVLTTLQHLCILPCCAYCNFSL